jgi:hypothetical protein
MMNQIRQLPLLHVKQGTSGLRQTLLDPGSSTFEQ